jgi:uncharacterized membrane protein
MNEEFHPKRRPVNLTLLEKGYKLRGRQVTRNVNQQFEKTASFGDHLADRLSEIAGSWGFIIFFGLFIFGWAILNTFILVNRAYDPYPYVFLNLMLSTLAALQAPVIMMSQNRQTEKDRIDADLDYQVNLKAEAEIAELHHKLDELREEKWVALVASQEEQIRLLETVIEKLTANKPL